MLWGTDGKGKVGAESNDGESSRQDSVRGEGDPPGQCRDVSGKGSRRPSTATRGWDTAAAGPGSELGTAPGSLWMFPFHGGASLPHPCPECRSQ